MGNAALVIACKSAINYFATIYMVWSFLSVILERRRPAYVFWLFFAARFFLYMLPSLDTFQQAFAGSKMLVQINFVYRSFWMVASLFLMYYFWKGDVLKVMFGTFLGEIIVTPITGLGLVIMNLIAGEEELMTYATENINLANLIIPLVYITLFRKLLKVMKPWLLRYREWEVTSRFGIWLFVLSYMLSQYVALIKWDMISYEGPIVIGAVCLLCLGLGIILYRTHLQSERMQLLHIQKTLDMQYQEIQREIRTIEKMRPKMEAYVDAISKSQTGTGSEQLVSDYLGELKGKYKTLRAGMYSNDPMVDAVFAYYADMCEENGIPIEISTWTYRKEEADSKKTARRLTEELERAVQKNKKLPKEQRGLRATLGTVKGQVILKVEETAHANEIKDNKERRNIGCRQ